MHQIKKEIRPNDQKLTARVRTHAVFAVNLNLTLASTFQLQNHTT